jgi:hypothetical protein
MYTLNFYLNFVPRQELDDWFEHWSIAGIKPLLLVEYGVPFGWDWTMYRGWYNGQREFGSAAVPWEYCLAEWNAQFLGDPAYNISDREKRNLRWEAQQFRQGHSWYRWDYPYPVGDARLEEMQQVQAAYTTDNWRAFRTWGLSGNSPWEHDRFWKLRDGFQHQRQALPVDFDNLQQPGYSPDFIDRTYARFDLAYERSDWVPSLTARSLMRNNLPLLAWIAGKPERFTTKDHIFYPGETVEKQLILLNNSRRTVSGDVDWSTDLDQTFGGTKSLVVPTGDQVRIPLQFTLPDSLAPGNYRINATFKPHEGSEQDDSFTFQVVERRPRPRVNSKIALFDPPGETGKWLERLGIDCQKVEPEVDLGTFELLLIGKKALTVSGPAPSLKRVRDGLKVVVFEQTAEVLEKRLGFRVEEYGLRQAWRRIPDSPLLAGLSNENLRDWRGASTLLPPTLDYTLSPRYSGAPAVQWCGLEVTRLWRCGNWGNVASALIEKPPRGDFLPILDGGYALQYSPLLEYREGLGLILFCQMDVTGRTENDPAAETLANNILKYSEAWRPEPRRTAVYVGDPAGKAWLEACGIESAPFKGDSLADNQVLVVGPGGGQELAAKAADTGSWAKNGGRILALGLDQDEANSLLGMRNAPPKPPNATDSPSHVLRGEGRAGRSVPGSSSQSALKETSGPPMKVTMRVAEHIAAYFDPPGAHSLLAGVAPADVHNRDPRSLPLIVDGATVYGDGVLATSNNVVFFQLPPFQVSKALGALSKIQLSEDPSDHKQRALISLGGLAFAQFGQKLPAGNPGKTYTFAARVKAVAGRVTARLEVERAGQPWDRAGRGLDTNLSSGESTELHLTFTLDKAYPEGWQTYVYASGEDARLQVDRIRFYQGAYVSSDNPAWSSTAAPDRNLLKNPDFASGLAPWYFNHGPEPFNLRRTFVRTSFAMSRLLGNLGVSASTPLLERFSEPVDHSGGPSVDPTAGRWLEGLYLTRPTEWDDPYRFFGW